MQITIKTNLDQVLRQLELQQQRVREATARGLSDTVRETRLDVMRELPRVFDRPVPFTLRGIGYTPAHPSALTARVFIRPAQARYLALMIAGGTERPKRRALLDPVALELDLFGNIGRRKIKQLLRRPDVFSATLRSTPGLWQRVGRQVRLLVRYTDDRQVRPRFDFVGIAKRTIARRLQANLRAQLARALRSAK